MKGITFEQAKELNNHKELYEMSTSTPKERLLKEREELAWKLEALTYSMTAPIWDKIPTIQKGLLIAQKDVMAAYLAILDNRIELWTENI